VNANNVQTNDSSDRRRKGRERDRGSGLIDRCESRLRTHRGICQHPASTRHRDGREIAATINARTGLNRTANFRALAHFGAEDAPLAEARCFHAKIAGIACARRMAITNTTTFVDLFERPIVPSDSRSGIVVQPARNLAGIQIAMGWSNRG
jgi:hypothetical protein